MTVVVDTSALYALLDEDDVNHIEAVRGWTRLLARESPTAHAYVVLETSALVQRQLGMKAVERLHRGLLPIVRVTMVDTSTHQRAVERWLAQRLRGLSLVDVTSFVVMRDRGLDHAFAFDDDFVREAFSLWDDHAG